MAVTVFLIGLAASGLGNPGSAADSVTLRDGTVLLGQLLDSADRRAPVVMLVRRGWAEANLPDRAAAWEKLEAPLTNRAEAQWRARLTSWRRDRPTTPAEGDRITPWLDRELARRADRGAVGKSPLMVIRLARTEVKAIDRKPRAMNRMLRLGWISRLPDVESMSAADLTQALEGRGFAPNLAGPVSVDSLLPIQPETDSRWLIRRAATEVANDPGGRLLRYQGLILPEPPSGEAPPIGASLDVAIGSIRATLGEAAVADPLPAKLRDLGGRGRVGAVVTRLELAPDFSTVAVETALWVRAGDRWSPALVQSATARPGDLPPGAGDGLADDPQIKTVFGLIDALGFGEIPADLKRQSLGIGAATKKALGQARGALERDLEPLVLSLEAAPEPGAAGKPGE